MVAFYNQGDQEIYDEGEHFIPQQQYRLNKFNNTVAPMPMDGTQQVTQEFGIPYTGAFTNAGGGGGGGFGKFGNLDESNMKMFYDQNVWDGSSWVNKPVRGYYDPASKTYKTKKGKNIKHAGLFTGDPKKGDIEGEDFQFPGMFAMLKKMKEKFTGPTIDKNIVPEKITTDVKDFEQKQATTPGYGSAQGGQGFDAGTGATTTSGYSGRTGQKEMMSQGGRIGFFQGALADTAEGQAMSPGTSATGEFRGGEGGQGDGNNQVVSNMDTTGNAIVNNNLITDTPELTGFQKFKNFISGGANIRNIDKLQEHNEDIAAQTTDKPGFDPNDSSTWEFRSGGRVGLQGGGGPAGGASAGGDYGGNVNPEQEYAGRTFQETYGGDKNNQGNTGGITQLVDTDLMRTDPNVEINYDFKKLPLYLQAKLHNKNLLTEDNINLEGQVGGSAGLVDYGMNFTGEGATGSYIGMGPVNVDIDPHKNIRNISFDQDIGNWNVQGNTDLENYSGAVNYQPNDWLTLGGSMDNTGQRNVGFEISKKWGQPEHTYSTQALLKENPNLIYGMEGQNLRYGGLAGLL